MRPFGARYLKDQAEKRIRDRADVLELDAIVITVDPINRKARVQIQNSSAAVWVGYPEGYEQTPFYLKPGMGVRIVRKGGSRGRLEVVGIGQTVPTNTAGSISPIIPASPDALTSGGAVYASAPPDMHSNWTAGTVRIDDVEVPFTSGDAQHDAAPGTGQYRYDLLVVGDNGTVDLVKGTASATPALPSVPAGHVLIRSVLIPANASAIDQTLIGAVWTAPEASFLSAVADDDELAWAEETTHVRVTVKDQYGNNIGLAAPGWNVTLEILSGSGTVTSAEEGPLTTVHQHYGGGTAYYDFTYTRPAAPTDASPTLQAVLVDIPRLQAGLSITLLDENGYPMYGTPYGDPGAYLPAGEHEETYSGTVTIDWADGASQWLELTADCTITLTNCEDGEVYRLAIIQENGGSHTITSWTGVDRWMGGSPPTLTTTEHSGDAITFWKVHGEVWAAIAADFY